jgi:hypothetical protein
MTTLWKPSRQWPGATVAVLGCGPAMSQAVADALRPHRVIAVNYAVQLAPWADMLVALDDAGKWPAAWHAFAGLRVTGVANPAFDALYIGPQWERVRRGNAEIEIINSGLTAIRIAAAMGAAKIILAGFAPHDPHHFYNDLPDAAGYVGVAEGLVKITGELVAAGVQVEHFAPASPPTSREDPLTHPTPAPAAESPPAARLMRARPVRSKRDV